MHEENGHFYILTHLRSQPRCSISEKRNLTTDMDMDIDDCVALLAGRDWNPSPNYRHQLIN